MPRLRAESPAFPDFARPSRGARVFVDTNVLFFTSDTLALLALAQQGLLEVCWSPYVAAELSRTTGQRYLNEARWLEEVEDIAPEGVKSSLVTGRLWVLARLERLGKPIYDAVSVFERYWESPDPEQVRVVSDRLAAEDLPDALDREILVGALALKCDVLISRDQPMFPHGGEMHGVQLWHPDTFLTAFFQGDAQAYDQVRLLMGMLRAVLPPPAETARSRPYEARHIGLLPPDCALPVAGSLNSWKI